MQCPISELEMPCWGHRTFQTVHMFTLSRLCSHDDVTGLLSTCKSWQFSNDCLKTWQLHFPRTDLDLADTFKFFKEDDRTQYSSRKNVNNNSYSHVQMAEEECEVEVLQGRMGLRRSFGEGREKRMGQQTREEWSSVNHLVSCKWLALETEMMSEMKKTAYLAVASWSETRCPVSAVSSLKLSWSSPVMCAQKMCFVLRREDLSGSVPVPGTRSGPICLARLDPSQCWYWKMQQGE